MILSVLAIIPPLTSWNFKARQICDRPLNFCRGLAGDGGRLLAVWFGALLRQPERNVGTKTFHVLEHNVEVHRARLASLDHRLRRDHVPALGIRQVQVSHVDQLPRLLSQLGDASANTSIRAV